MTTEAKVGWSFIKTPHTVRLYLGKEVSNYNPKTGEHEIMEQSTMIVPCYVTVMSKNKQFEEYGFRDKEIIIVRFNNEVPVFDKVEFDGHYYRLLEHTQVKDKRAYRMERVAR